MKSDVACGSLGCHRHTRRNCILTINLVPRFQKVPKSDLHRLFSTIKIFYWRASIYSDAASGWEGWALARSEFGSSVNPITTKGADYAHHITGGTRC